MGLGLSLDGLDIHSSGWFRYSAGLKDAGYPVMLVESRDTDGVSTLFHSAGCPESMPAYSRTAL